MSTCNRLDLQTLGSQLVMPKNLPDHCPKRELVGSVHSMLSKSLSYYVLKTGTPPESVITELQVAKVRPIHGKAGRQASMLWMHWWL